MESSPDPAHQVVFALLGAASKIEHRLDRGLSHIKGISFSEYQLLSALRGEHQASATRVDLAALVGMTPSGVTRALKPLERIGYVETTKDERDARRSLATLTPQGGELLRDADGVVADTIGTLTALAGLPADQAGELAGLLEELARG